jgi:hypothetical protein
MEGRSPVAAGWPLSFPVLLLRRRFDILFSGPCPPEPVGTFLVGGVLVDSSPSATR